MAGDPVGDILLVLRHQLLEEVLVELAEEVFLQLDLLALSLLVILSEMLAVTQLVCPVRLGSVSAAGAHKQTLEKAESVRTLIVRNVIRGLWNNLNTDGLKHNKRHSIDLITSGI